MIMRSEKLLACTNGRVDSRRARHIRRLTRISPILRLVYQTSASASTRRVLRTSQSVQRPGGQRSGSGFGQGPERAVMLDCKPLGVVRTRNKRRPGGSATLRIMAAGSCKGNALGHPPAHQCANTAKYRATAPSSECSSAFASYGPKQVYHERINTL